MSGVASQPEILEDAPISTWFGIGGGADRLCRVRSADDVAWCVREHDAVRVLGDGANLLVDDAGVGSLVLDTAGLADVDIDATSGRVFAGAGVRLPQLITRTVREGLGGLEVLAGIPASVGGATKMNAGGRFGSIADVIAAVYVVREDGAVARIERSSLAYGYRVSGIQGVIVGAEFSLIPGDPVALRDRLKSCMAYKKSSQPMGEPSAGCCFKNPVLEQSIEGVGEAGARVSAGMLIDRAGCKGIRVGGARVSESHANFLVTGDEARAADVVALMHEVVRRVNDRFGVPLEREVVVWSRTAEAGP